MKKNKFNDLLFLALYALACFAFLAGIATCASGCSVRKSKSSVTLNVDSTHVIRKDTTTATLTDSLVAKASTKAAWFEVDTASTTDRTVRSQKTTLIEYDTLGRKRRELITQSKTARSKQATAKKTAAASLQSDSELHEDLNLALAHAGISDSEAYHVDAAASKSDTSRFTLSPWMICLALIVLLLALAYRYRRKLLGTWYDILHDIS